MRRPAIASALLLLLSACGPTEITRGTKLTYRVDREGAVQGVVEIIERRLETQDIPFELTIKPGDYFELTVPELTAPEMEFVKYLVCRPGTIEFLLVAPEAVERAERARRAEMGAEYPGPQEGHRWLRPPFRNGRTPSGPDRLVQLPSGPDETFSSRDLDPDSLVLRPELLSDGFVVMFAVVESRVAALEAFTEKNVKRSLAIVIDGEMESAPVIQEKLPGRGQISGGGMDGFSREEAEMLAALLRIPPLPAAIALYEETKLETR